jgi:hypothetical protein
MKLQTQAVLGLVLALALAPAFWSDGGSARAQSDRKSTESMQPGVVETRTGPIYSSWSVPEPVEVLNTYRSDLPMCLSRDGLSLYFLRTSAVTSYDVYVTHRPDLEADWGAPVKLPNGINSSADDRGAFVSADGLSLYFASDRAGSRGFDLYVSRRTNVYDDNDWQPPENLSAVNSPGYDGGPALIEDPESGTTQLYFHCAPAPGGQEAELDIYMSVLGPDGFEPPTRVAELSSRWMDRRVYPRHDGLEIYFVSDRSGSWAIYQSWRHSMTGPWSVPVAVIDRADLSDPHVLGVSAPVLSWDGTTLYICVWDDLTMQDDIYVLHRKKMFGTLAP